MHDRSYIEALNEWFERHQKWERGEDPDRAEFEKKQGRRCYFAEWDGDAPRVEWYRPDWKPGEATWYQVYENVTEGTPITPPFETKEQLVNWLVNRGSLHDGPWGREQAESFVEDGYRPSFLVQDGKILKPKEQ